MTLQLDLLTDYNAACNFVSLHREFKTRLALSLQFQSCAPTQTHYINQLKQ